MFWFNKQHPKAIYMDNRKLEDTLCDGRKLVINPDIMADFTKIPFKDDSFKLVVFDPPHLIRAGKTSWLGKKYGVLGVNWQEDLEDGFNECFRVLEPNGILIFKWNEDQVKLSEVLKLAPQKPLFGDKRSKTHWLVFMKEGE